MKIMKIMKIMIAPAKIGGRYRQIYVLSNLCFSNLDMK